MKWFGESWNTPMCEETDQVAVPVGQPCAHCDEVIKDGDRGVTVPCLLDNEMRDLPYHLNCHLRSVLGSVAHIEGRCSCYVPGASDNDDPTLTRREAADAAVKAWQERQIR